MSTRRPESAVPLVSAASLAILLSGCGAWENATVTIAYSPDTKQEAWRSGKSPRQQVEAAFREFSLQHGYKCRPHIKRVEEITCRGPQDLYLTFQPTTNKPEFVARFSWVDSPERTHEAFLRQVAAFRRQVHAEVDVAPKDPSDTI